MVLQINIIINKKENSFSIKHWNNSNSILAICFFDIAVKWKKEKERSKESISNNWEWKQWLSCKYHSRNLSVVSSKFFLCIIFGNLKISERKTAFNSVSQ